ncbi:MAG: S-layer homology domain-containing protein [Lachnospiraceae bacterium]|nr:S-layer homology domain-containing protein [Lachnospiraceae bacterium]
MRKKMLSLALALILSVSLMPSAFAAEGVGGFTDVPSGAWYTEELAYALEKGFVSGTSASSFSPDANVSRAQFVTMLGRMLDVNTADYTAKKFDDVDPSSWYGPYVSWAAEEGYVNGISVKEFAPNNNITFEQMGAILSNYIDKSGVVLTPSWNVFEYSDFDSVSPWAQSSMAMMELYDLLPVSADGAVRPSSSVTRSEAVVSLVRLSKGDGKGGNPISTTPTQPTTPDEEKPKDELGLRIQQIHDEMRKTGKINDLMSEKEKAIAYYMWMCQNCIYRDNTDYPNRHSAYGSLIEGVGVCDGLSHGYAALLQSEGIVCRVVQDAYHAWNVAILDGVEFKIDTAFGVSSSYNYDGTYVDENAQASCDKCFMDEQDWLDKWYDYPPLS